MIDEDEIHLTQAEYYMQECFDLAQIALGRTSPNPIVGAIVLDEKGMPVGKGYHNKAGQEHAEVIAINQAGNRSKNGTLIVNLEPCCHTGKTPPCTDLIIKSGIKRVIFSSFDPNNPAGKRGKDVLQSSGIKIISSVLENEGKEVNKFFFKWINMKFPWVTLKQGQTLDGMVAIKDLKSKWITSEDSRNEVCKLRNIYDAIMISSKTIHTDNPELTVRNVKDGRNPIRIILDSGLTTAPEAKVYNDNSLIFLVTKSGHPKNKLEPYLKRNKNTEIMEVSCLSDGRLDLHSVFSNLAKHEILSVLIESGPTLAGELLNLKLIDEYILFIAPRVFGGNNGIPALELHTLKEISNSPGFKLFDHKLIGNDLMLSLRPI